MPSTDLEPRALLRALFDEAVAAAVPERCVPAHLPAPPRGRLVVLGAGKASAAMARAVEMSWAGDLSGLVITRHGHAVPCERIEIIEAGHPVPDEAGRTAALRTLELVRPLVEDDLALCLISGGASALLSLPADSVTLEDKQRVSEALLRSGADIAEINCVRKHLSAVKGGRLAAACHPARTLALLISDVPGDDPAVIGSGPTVGDPTTFADARDILRRRAVDAPPAVIDHLREARDETPAPGAAVLARASAVVVARPRLSLEAAAAAARRAGVRPVILGDAVQGEARAVAREQAAVARSAHRDGRPSRPPCVLLSGGETTVTVRGKGRGGRNAEFLLALAIALDGHPEVHALAGDTDGIDGPGEAAGARIAPDTLARARAAGIDPRARLDDNDALGFFEALGDHLVTGPTLTNVGDFRAILVTG